MPIKVMYQRYDLLIQILSMKATLAQSLKLEGENNKGCAAPSSKLKFTLFSGFIRLQEVFNEPLFIMEICCNSINGRQEMNNTFLELEKKTSKH